VTARDSIPGPSGFSSSRTRTTPRAQTFRSCLWRNTQGARWATLSHPWFSSFRLLLCSDCECPSCDYITRNLQWSIQVVEWSSIQVI